MCLGDWWGGGGEGGISEKTQNGDQDGRLVQRLLPW